ncbi:hypothetical protein ACERK3_15870 [Phycisphaerales bacterium AB-hyl4]|uniref:Uncharacterized protein n=1 Tax=Natronomicrosphaera hydrolytica TaxID=3242702 RepID=A0ABV4U838_9BACT
MVRHCGFFCAAMNANEFNPASHDLSDTAEQEDRSPSKAIGDVDELIMDVDDQPVHEADEGPDAMQILAEQERLAREAAAAREAEPEDRAPSTLPEPCQKSADVLAVWESRFGDLLEYGHLSNDGRPIRANPDTLPSAYNRRTQRHHHEKMSAPKRLKHTQTGKFYGVQVHQERWEQWFGENSVYSLAATAGLANDPDLDQLIQPADKPIISIERALEYLNARPFIGNKRFPWIKRPSKTYADLRAKLDRAPNTILNRLKRTLLDAEGTLFFTCRRTIARETVVILKTRYVTELMIDIDGGHIKVNCGDKTAKVKLPKAMTHAAAMAIARRIIADLIPPGCSYWLGPSTNGGGAHLRIMILWADDKFELRNQFITHFQRHLKARYQDPDGHAAIDLVRGRPCYFVHNPDFHKNYFQPAYPDLEDGPTVGDLYQKQKTELGPDATLRPGLERIIRVHGGDQGTKPLHPRDRNPEGFAQYMDGKPVPQHQLAMLTGWDMVRCCPLHDEQKSSKQRRQGRRARKAAPTSPLGSYVEGVECVLPPVNSKAGWALAPDAAEEHDHDGHGILRRRSWLAGHAVRQEKGDRSRAIEHTLQLWELEEGPTSDRERHTARVRKAESDVDAFINGIPGKIEPYDPAKTGKRGVRYDEMVNAFKATVPHEQLLRGERSMRGMASQRRIDQINSEHGGNKHGSCVDYHLLTVLREGIAFAMTYELAYTCTYTGQTLTKGRDEVPAGFLQALLQGHGCPTDRVNSTAAAGVRLLTEELGLVSRTRNYLLGVPGKARGECRRFKLTQRYTQLPWAEGLLQEEDYVPAQVVPAQVQVQVQVQQPRGAQGRVMMMAHARECRGAEAEAEQKKNETIGGEEFLTGVLDRDGSNERDGIFPPFCSLPAFFRRNTA